MQKRNQTTHYFMLKIISHEFLFVIVFFFLSLFFVVVLFCLYYPLLVKLLLLVHSLSLCFSFNMFSLSFELIQSAEQQQQQQPKKKKTKKHTQRRREKSSAFVNGSCESVFIRKFSISISFHFVFDHENSTQNIFRCI